MPESTKQKYNVNVENGGLEVLERLADDWRNLLQTTNGDDPYSRPEWVLAHLRAYSPNAKLAVLSLRENGNVVSILPFVRESGSFSGLPARKLRMPLSMPGACSDLVMGHGLNPEDAIHAVWEALKALPGWDVLEVPSVYENTTMERLSRLAQSERYRTAQLPLPPLPWITLAGRDVEKLPPSPTLRSRLRQGERKLREMGELTLRKVETAEVVQLFYQLEASGWKGREKSAILCDPRSLQFFNEVARESEKAGHLVFYFLELDGKPIAAHFGLYYRDCYYAPKIAYDENYRQYRVGHLILSKILRECAKQGISQYPMGVLEEWKTEWTKDSRSRTFQYIFNKGTRARLLYLVRFQIKPGVKRLIRRSGSGTPALQENSTEGK